MASESSEALQPSQNKVLVFLLSSLTALVRTVSAETTDLQDCEIIIVTARHWLTVQVHELHHGAFMKDQLNDLKPDFL